MPQFKVDQCNARDIQILRLSGDLDAHTASGFEDIIRYHIKKGNFQILVNFKDLNYISSAGLGVFMGHISSIREHGGDIKMCDMSPHVFRIFDLIGFPIIYDIVNSEEEALGMFDIRQKESS